MFPILSSSAICKCKNIFLTFRPSYEAPTVKRSAHCWDQRKFCWRFLQEMFNDSLSQSQSLSSHESKAARPSGLVVLHHNTVNDFTISTEISLQAVLGRFPAQATNEEFSSFDDEGREREGVDILSRSLILSSSARKKLSHHQKMNVGIPFLKIKSIFSSFPRQGSRLRRRKSTF